MLGPVAPQDRLGILITLTLLAGIFQLVLGLLHLGWLIRFVPYSVMTGFINGVAVLIILGQLGDLTDYRSRQPNKLLQTVDTITHPVQVDPGRW